MASFRVIVVGGGVTGLIAARDLREKGVAVTLIEGGFPFGGRVQTRFIDIPNYGRAGFDLGTLFLPSSDHHDASSAPTGLPTIRFASRFTRGSPPLSRFQIATEHREAETNFHESLLRPTTGGTQEWVNHLLPRGADPELDVRTLTEVTAIEPYHDGWRVRTRHRAHDDGEWVAGDSVTADAVVLTQPVPDALALLDASKVPLPDGLRDELLAIRYDPAFVLLAAFSAPTAMLAPIMQFFDGSPLRVMIDNHAVGTSPLGPAVTVQATSEWSREHWALPDEEVAGQLLAAIARWSSRSVWHQLLRWPRAHPQCRIRLPFAQLTTPPLFLAGDSFAEYAGSPVDSACTSGVHVAKRVCQVLTAIRRGKGGRTTGTRHTLEVAVTSEYDAIQAVSSGADRLLVCSALELGGLTPTDEAIARAVAAAAFPRDRKVSVTVLVRPRPGGFDYGWDEYSCLREQAGRAFKLGADAVAFGILHHSTDRNANDGSPDVRVDFARCREIVELCKATGKLAVFHRAFDFIPDRRAALHDLIQLGVDRVLTSGRRLLALDGMGQLEADIQFAGWDIEVVAVGGITAETIGVIASGTGCDHLLGSFRRNVRDVSLAGSPQLAAAMSHPEAGYAVTDGAKVSAAVACLRALEQRSAPVPEE